ncbi:Rqc2 family fibronectin-binding protein [Ferviditalea candida]|uniref:Rqc2 homolog RqcH n=1 Tax=Ferviditalea candida TaxID=3108399 RepID=A0ABU5ZJJ0_9BACL|nr:NFACT RNA binding domain-containing protein [Paenibacillaceae bacterium T2]
MALDGIVIHAAVDELKAITGGRIGKIYQPTEHDILLQIRTRGSNVKLLLSAHPAYPRIYFTEHSYMNPLEAPMFCMLLRKHLENGIVESVSQADLERIITIDIRHRDELGDVRIKRLVVELMGRHSNIILIDTQTQTILDGIRHVTPAISSYRVVLPGSPYAAPPDQHKASPLEVDERQFIELMTAQNPPGEAGRHTADKRIVELFSGISPLLAKEIVHLSGHPANPAGLWKGFNALMEKVRLHQYEPNIVITGQGKLHFSAVPLTHLEGERTTFSSISKCLEAYYGEKVERDTVKQKVSDLHRLLKNEKSKNAKKLDKLRETLEEARDADKYRILGELLTAHLHMISRGDKRVEVTNYYDEHQQTIAIELDPQLTPSENAQKYFKKYNKMKNSLAAVHEQMDMAKKENAYIETLLQQLDHASLHDIGEIREELAEQGYIRLKKAKERSKKKNDRPLLHCYTSSEGIPIYVGKNNTQNDYLTNRFAHPSDTWLHTKDIPGSHVVISGSGYGEQTLFEAAQLAAYFSQARESSLVPVDHTLIRHVRKPNGAKPGYVVYDHQKTLFVTPDEQQIHKLNKQTGWP